MAMAQIPKVDALKPIVPALAEGAGVTEAETVAEGALVAEALAVTRVIEAVEIAVEIAEEEMADLLTTEEIAVAMTDTNDCVTTSPVVPVTVKAAEKAVALCGVY